MTQKRSIWTIFVALAVVVAACGSGDTAGSTTTAIDAGAEDGGDLTVVATTTILGDVVSNVVGDEATVEVIMPVGADAHDFQASSQQVGMMSTSDLVVAIGLGLEEGLHDALESAESDGAHVLEVAPMLDPIPFGDHDHEEHEEGEAHEEETAACDPDMEHQHEEGGAEEEDHEHEEEGAEGEDHEHEEEGVAGEEHEHEHGSCDPHVWMDPLRMAVAAQLIADELEEMAPGGGWVERAEAYAAELTDANAQIEETLSVIPEEGRVMVTNHEAFGYFADLYDFEIVGVVIPGGSTLGEPSSSELAELVEVINEEQVPAIFTDISSPSSLAETVAEEAGGEVEVVGLYTESIGEAGSGADTLIGLLTTNAQRIADSLS